MIVTVVARSVPFDNYTNDFVSTDVQAAIEEIVYSFFIWRIIRPYKRVTVRYEQQMPVYQELRVESNGEIVIRGEVIIRP